MIGIFIIGILVVAGLIALKMNHLRHKIWVIVLLLFALFLYTSIMIVNTTNELDFGNSEGIFSALKVYVGWLGNGFENLKVIVGNVIKMDWTKSDPDFLNKTLDKVRPGN